MSLQRPPDSVLEILRSQIRLISDMDVWNDGLLEQKRNEILFLIKEYKKEKKRIEGKNAFKKDVTDWLNQF